MPRHRAKEPQIVRCLTLLLAMARTRRGINLGGFAAERGWNPRTTYRDVDTLGEAGVPVEHPEQGRFSVPEHWIPAGTIDAKRDELFALDIARRLAPGLQSTLIGRALDSLWAKLSTPGRQPRLPLSDDRWLRPRAPGAIDYGPHRIVLDTVRAGILERRALHVHYCRSDGTASDRVIEPTFVHWEPATEALYVFAWCQLREALRVFALHRITAAELTDQLFAARRDSVTEISKAFRLWVRPTVERVVLHFSPAVAGEVRERRWHASAQLTDTADGGVVLEMQIAAPDELERWLLGYGPDVEVEAPQALAARVRERHAAAVAPARLGTIRANRPPRVEPRGRASEG